MGPLNTVESAIIIFLQTNLSFLTPVMQFFSFLGQEYFYILVLPLFFWCIDYLVGLKLGVMLMATNFVNLVAKLAFHTPRPYWENQKVNALWAETSFSTPSGHAQNAAAMWGLFSTTQSKKWITRIILFTIFMIGFSRIFLGVHYIHDVLLGWLIGYLLVMVFSVFVTPVSQKYLAMQPSERISLALIVSFSVVFVSMIALMVFGKTSIPAEWIQNAARSHPETTINPLSKEGIFTLGGLIAGFLIGLGLFFNKHQGIPNAQGSLKQKVLRYIIGILVAGIIYLGLKMILPDGESFIALIGRYLRYALLGYWVAGGAPELFCQLNLISTRNVKIEVQ